MARYFFHSEDGRSVLDAEGTEFATLREARVEAVRLMAALLADDAQEFWASPEFKVIVTDDHELVLFVLDLSAIESPALSYLKRG